MKTMKSLLACMAMAWVALPGVRAQAATAGDETLPASWCTLPEDCDARSTLEEPASLTKAQIKGIDRVVDANRDAFALFEGKLAKRSFLDWRMEACMTDLTLSGSGLLGVMVAAGETTISLYWRRPESRFTGHLETGLNVEIPTDATPAQMEHAMEPVIRAVLGTGRVQDETAMRSHLNEYANNAREMAQYLCQAGQGDWKVSKLRMEVSVEASGKVVIATLGGGIRIRFDWVPKAKPKTLVTKQENALKGEGLKRLGRSLVQVFQNTHFVMDESKPMKLKEITLGLGMFGEGNVAVAKLGAKAFGYISLVPNPSREGRDIVGEQTDIEPIPIVDDSSNEKWQSWASAKGVPYQEYRTREGEKCVVYSAMAKMVQRGFEKASRIADSVADRCSHTRLGCWEVYQVKNSYSLSLSGDLVLFKLGGTGTIDFNIGR